MGAVKGLLSTNDPATNELVGEFQETIFVRNSRGYNVGTTLFGLMSRLDNEPAENLEYNWFERNPVRKTVYAAATSTTTSTTVLVFDDNNDTGEGAQAWNALITPGTILMHDADREFLKVISANGTTSVNVVRQIGGTNAIVTDNDTFTIVTVGRHEGADPISALYENPQTKENFIQTFNSTVELTNAFKGSVLRTDIDGPLTDRRIQALEKISRDVEFSYFLGVKKEITVGDAGHTDVTTGKQYYTGGIYDGIVQAGLTSTNILNGVATTGVALTTLNNWMSAVMPYGSDVKLAFAGPKAYAAFSNYANSNSNGYRIMQNETVYGMNIQVINTPFGELNLTQHPLFREALGLNNWMFVTDLPHMTQKIYEKLFLEPNIQANGNDSYKEQYRAKLGLKLKFANAFGAVTGFEKIV